MENMQRVIQNLQAKLIRQREAVSQTETHIGALEKVEVDLQQIEMLQEKEKSTKK